MTKKHLKEVLIIHMYNSEVNHEILKAKKKNCKAESHNVYIKKWKTMTTYVGSLGIRVKNDKQEMVNKDKSMYLWAWEKIKIQNWFTNIL